MFEIGIDLCKLDPLYIFYWDNTTAKSISVSTRFFCRYSYV